MRCPLFLCGLALFSLSCAFLRVGDNGIRVKGELLFEAQSTDQCNLELRFEGREDALRSWSIAGVFEESFTIDPRPRTYYVAVVCRLAGEIYRSQLFRVRDNSYLYNPLDLGRISVRAGPGPGSAAAREITWPRLSLADMVADPRRDPGSGVVVFRGC